MSDLPLPKPVDDSPQTLRIPALSVRQPVGDMYIASVDSRVVTRITDFDVRRIEKEARDIETYLGIQRPLNPVRVEEIGRYVNYEDASFPGSIILSLDSDYAEYDEDTKELVIRNFLVGDKTPTRMMRDIAKVLDGQHRIEGLKNLEANRSFDVIVTAFIGADISDQAYIFATVNLEQRKVNRSLAYDLFALARSRSPERTCHNIAISFDRDPESPFYHRIKRLGTATPGRSFETLTQATFVEGLLDHISRSPKADRNLLLKKRALPRPTTEESKRLVLRGFFAAEDDISIAKTYHNYFSAVRDRWPDAWAEKGSGYMLNRTNGYRALSRFLRPAFLHLSNNGDHVVSKESFGRVLSRVKLESRDFNTELFPPGSSGESVFYQKLKNDTGLG